MILTILLAIMMMAGLFLMLLSGVGFIQDKRFFTSAPKAVQDAVLPHKERFAGAHALGWVLAVISILLMLGAIVIGAIAGIQAEFSFSQLFIRFTIMFLLLKAYDIIFFDWVLLCNSGFFPLFYPETKSVLGPHLFGYNKKTHIAHIIASPVIAAILALVCTLI